MKKIIKIILISILSLCLIALLSLTAISFTSAGGTTEMYDEISKLNTININYEENIDHFLISHKEPIANIVFIPGGLVKADAYLYLAHKLAIEGYQVYITKNLFNLAILTPNYSKKFIDNNLDNYFIGHSLGGLVASNVTINTQISKLVLLASYPVQSIEIPTLSITASNDGVINQELYHTNTELYLKNASLQTIEGGNHAGFGWYGDQKNDGTSTISVKQQQDTIFILIVNFLIS